MKNYYLDGHTPVACDNLLEWAQKFDRQNRIVAQTHLPGFFVSTVFLGLDHQWGDGPPLLFETMVFKVKDSKRGEDIDCRRCSTWEQAEQQHSEVVKELGAG